MNVGAKAVEGANEGKTGMMVVMEREKSRNYKIDYKLYDIHSIANVEKKVPREWICTKHYKMKDSFIKYVKPLIIGELTPIYKNGLPVHLVRK